MQSMMKHNETIIKNLAKIELLHQKGFPFIELLPSYLARPWPMCNTSTIREASFPMSPSLHPY